MNQDELIRYAKEAGMMLARGGNGYWDNPKQLTKFAELITAPLELQLQEALAREAKLREALVTVQGIVMVLQYQSH